MKTRLRLPINLRLLAAVSTVFLFLLIAFATHYQVSFLQLEKHTSVLEMMAATIPLLALLLASVFSRPPAKRRQLAQQRSGRSAPR